MGNFTPSIALITDLDMSSAFAAVVFLAGLGLVVVSVVCVLISKFARLSPAVRRDLIRLISAVRRRRAGD